jgi:mercuric ion transport protein
MTINHTSQPTVTGGSVLFGKKSLRLSVLIGIWLFVACLLIQLFTVGMSVFINPSWWTHHSLFSHVIGVLGFVLLLTALFGRFPREIWSLIALMNLLFVVQGSTVHLPIPFSSAFHPVNALLLFWVATAIAHRTQRMVIGSKQDHA